MKRFPGEPERTAELQAEHADLFALAETLFDFWLDAPKAERIKTSTLPPLTGYLAFMLDVQAYRLFRSILEQCRRGEGFGAKILTRSLFESVLGVGFLLVEDVRIIVTSKNPQQASQPTKYYAHYQLNGTSRTRRHRLSRELRANLYYAHSVIEDHERAPKYYGEIPGNKRRADSLKKYMDLSNVTNLDKKIGPEWSYILRHHPFTYSGLDGGDLAKALGKPFARVRQHMYPFQSRAVHATDPLKFGKILPGHRITESFFSTIPQIYGCLLEALLLFFAHVTILKDNIGFGTDVDLAYDSLKRKLDGILRQRRDP
jgi:hypothetical protein